MALVLGCVGRRDVAATDAALAGERTPRTGIARTFTRRVRVTHTDEHTEPVLAEVDLTQRFVTRGKPEGDLFHAAQIKPGATGAANMIDGPTVEHGDVDAVVARWGHGGRSRRRHRLDR